MYKNNMLSDWLNQIMPRAFVFNFLLRNIFKKFIMKFLASRTVFTLYT